MSLSCTFLHLQRFPKLLRIIFILQRSPSTTKGWLFTAKPSSKCFQIEQHQMVRKDGCCTSVWKIKIVPSGRTCSGHLAHLRFSFNTAWCGLVCLRHQNTEFLSTKDLPGRDRMHRGPPKTLQEARDPACFLPCCRIESRSLMFGSFCSLRPPSWKSRDQ